LYLRIAKSGARYVAVALVTLLAVSAVTFAAASIKSPQAIAIEVLGRQTDQAQIDAFVKRHELDAPLPQRYVDWLADFAHGDWGRSITTDQPVRPELMPRLGRTLMLAAVSLLLVLPTSIALGALLAQRWGSRFDLGSTVGLTVMRAFPDFVLGVGVIMLFAVVLGWLPPESGTAIAFGSFTDKAKAYVLPAVTLVLVTMPYMVRMTRASARDALRAPHTRAAVLRGLPRRTVVWDHAMRTAALPIVSAAGLTLVHLLSGVIVIENVFGFPGIGQALVTAVGRGDTTSVEAIAVVMAAMFIAISLAADLLAVVFNPRLRSAT
jgi:peptide/nickel transport system permease protein